MAHEESNEDRCMHCRGFAMPHTVTNVCGSCLGRLVMPSNDTRALEVEGAAAIAAFDETEFSTARTRSLLDWSRRALAAVEVADLAYRNLFSQYTKGERTLEVAALRKQRDAALTDALDADREVDSWKERTIEWRRKYDARRVALEVAMGALERIESMDVSEYGDCYECGRSASALADPVVGHDGDFPCGIASRALATLRSGVAPGEAAVVEHAEVREKALREAEHAAAVAVAQVDAPLPLKRRGQIQDAVRLAIRELAAAPAVQRRPAREVAHETCNRMRSYCGAGQHHSIACNIGTACVEADRRGTP